MNYNLTRFAIGFLFLSLQLSACSLYDDTSEEGAVIDLASNTVLESSREALSGSANDDCFNNIALCCLPKLMSYGEDWNDRSKACVPFTHACCHYENLDLRRFNVYLGPVCALEASLAVCVGCCLFCP